MAVGTKVSMCRSCGSGSLRAVLDLGTTPVANRLVRADTTDDADPRFPLEVVFCEDCSLVQLGWALPAGEIFDEEYPYYSSFSDELCRHAAEHVGNLIRDRHLDDGSLAVEVASNDGYLLRNFVSAGIKAVGIDPAPGPAAAAEAIGVPTIVGFFGVDAAEQIVAEHGRAQVVTANNVMAHVPDLNDFVGGFAVLLADDGVLTVENPYVRDMVENVEFDTIYHEHYCYFSCTAVDALMRRHGLFLNDVEYFPNMHGGSLRWYIERHENRTERCRQYLDDEVTNGMNTLAYYERFSAQVRAGQVALRELLAGLAAQGRSVAAYGAAAKGATLLNSSGIGTDLIAYVVDRNVHKQGKLMPGCRLPILPAEQLLERQPDDLIVLAWNFAAEIVEQQAEYAARGGTFYRPLPMATKILARREDHGRSDAQQSGDGSVDAESSRTAPPIPA